MRAGSAWVVERARFVEIDPGTIEGYAEELVAAVEAGSGEEEPAGEKRCSEAAAAFAICMNAINFGSGWWPTIRKRPGHSGYATMAAGISERLDSAGPWSAEQLVAMNAGEVAAVLDQDPGHPLMAQFAAALRDVGAHLLDEHDGRYLGVVESVDSIPELAGLLADWDSFADVSHYEGRAVPFYKRAQLATADLHRAGLTDLPGVEDLTAFADNLVPHVLRVDAVLRLDPELTARIEAEELLAHGSPEEVELRAGAVHAVELLTAATGNTLTPAAIDSALWNRGRERRYKALPRPRSRNTAY